MSLTVTSDTFNDMRYAMGFRWYNWLGLAMLLFGGLISEPVFLEADSGLSSLWLIAAA